MSEGMYVMKQTKNNGYERSTNLFYSLYANTNIMHPSQAIEGLIPGNIYIYQDVKRSMSGNGKSVHTSCNSTDIGLDE